MRYISLWSRITLKYPDRYFDPIRKPKHGGLDLSDLNELLRDLLFLMWRRKSYRQKLYSVMIQNIEC